MKNVLIIDDEKFVVQPIETYIKGLGFNAVGLNSATAALKLDLAVFDLVISDFRMPDMDGIQFSNIMFNQFPNTPIILISGLLEFDGDLPENIVAILQKPFSFGELRKLLAGTGLILA